MNERIKKLMVEAIKGREREGLLNDEDKLEALMDKFAELIVKECILIITEKAEWIHADGTVEAITNLEKHFGVE